MAATTTPRHAPHPRPTQYTEEVWRRRESWEQLDRDESADDSWLSDDAARAPAQLEPNRQRDESVLDAPRSPPPPAQFQRRPRYAEQSSSCDICQREPLWVVVFVALVALALASAYGALLTVPLRTAQRATQDSLLAEQLRVAELSVVRLGEAADGLRVDSAAHRAEGAKLSEQLAAAELATAQSTEKAAALQEEVNLLRADAEALRLANRAALDDAERTQRQHNESFLARVQAAEAAADASRRETADAVAAAELQRTEAAELSRQLLAEANVTSGALVECSAQAQVRQVAAEALALQVETLQMELATRQERAEHLELEEKLAVDALASCRERLSESEHEASGLMSQL
jgi:hypothetical protein